MDEGNILFYFPIHTQQMGTADMQMYLRTEFNWKGRIAPKWIKQLNDMLEGLSSAPLKPYRWIDILKTFLTLKLMHEQVLGCAYRNTLQTMHRMIRKALRGWLWLPKDTPLGYIHAPIRSGGLRITNLSITIPLLQKSWFSKLLASDNPLEKAITVLPFFKTLLRRINLPCKVGGRTVCSTEEANAEWANQLMASMDGKNLASHNTDKNTVSTGWSALAESFHVST